MQDLLPMQSGLLAVQIGLPRELVDIRSGNKCFFARARQDEHPDPIVAACGVQAIAELVHCFAVERIQYLWAVEGDPRDLILDVEEYIFIGHLRFPFSPARVRPSSIALASASSRQHSHRTLDPPCGRSIRPEPSS